MPDALSCAAPVATEAPPSATDEDRWRRLGELRAELDRVDDALHDGLMRRAELVAQVGALGAKGRVPLRPGREASIVRRLVQRNRGALAPATLLRVWREVLAGSSAQQNRMRAVLGGDEVATAAREHFGATMSLEALDPAAAVERVRCGEAEVAVLPVEGEWWTGLGELQIVARLPFWSRPGAAEAFVVTAAPPDPSGQDRSLLLAEAGTALPGFSIGVVRASGGQELVDVDGFVTGDDKRLRGVAAKVLGAYAVPLGAVQVGEFA